LSDTGPRLIPLIFVDMNVFYPVRLADLVLSCAADGHFDLCVSDHLLDEIERVLINDKGLAADKALTFRNAVHALARLHVTEQQYAPTQQQLAGPDPDDLWHLAAAVSAQADVILTSNTRDFERMEIPSSLPAVAVVRPDDFFDQLVVDGLGADLKATIQRMSARLTKPHRTPSEILDGLEYIGLTKTAGRLRQV